MTGRSEKRRKKFVVGVRLEPDLFEAARARASAAGKTLPGLMRELLDQHLRPLRLETGSLLPGSVLHALIAEVRHRSDKGDP